MKNPSFSTFGAFIAAIACCLLVGSWSNEVLAQDLTATSDTEPDQKWYSLPESWKPTGWTLQTSLYTKHFDPDPEHNNDQNLISVEAHFERDWIIGAAVFDNSFGQPSQLVYMGKYWYLFGSKYWYGKVIGGFLHGYKEPYEDKIPFNGLGVAPVIVPSLGFRYKWLVVEGALGGVSTFTVTAGVHF